MDSSVFEKYIAELKRMKAAATPPPTPTPPPPQDNNNSQGMTGVGRLIVNVTSVRGLYPVGGAAVTVFTEEEGSQRIISRQVTDSSGKTEEIELEAPASTLAEAPDPQSRPYAYYNIRTEADGFVETFNYNVAVFDGVTSVQNVSLQPRTTGVDGNRPIIINEYKDYTL